MLETRHQGWRLRHPKVPQSKGRAPPALVKPQRKQRKTQIHKKELCENYEQFIERYVQARWEVVFPDWSSEQHPAAGQVGGYGVFFGDLLDVAEFIPVHECQGNNRGELRAPLRTQRQWGNTPSCAWPRCSWWMGL